MCKTDLDCPALNAALCEGESGDKKRYECKEPKYPGPSGDRPACYDYDKMVPVGQGSPQWEVQVERTSRSKEHCQQTKDGKFETQYGCWGTEDECKKLYADERKYGPGGITPGPSDHRPAKVPSGGVHDKIRDIIGRWLAIDLLLALGNAYATTNMLQRLGPRPNISQDQAVSELHSQLATTSADASAVTAPAARPSPAPTRTLQPTPSQTPHTPKPRSEKTLWIAFGIFLGVALVICIPIIALAARGKSRRRDILTPMRRT